MNIPLLTTTKLVVMQKSSLSATDTSQLLPQDCLAELGRRLGVSFLGKPTPLEVPRTRT